jgi:serine protease Do
MLSNKIYVVVLIIFTFILSGVTGFVGGLFANSQLYSQSDPTVNNPLYESTNHEMLGWNEDQLQSFIVDFLASMGSETVESSDDSYPIEYINDISIQEQLSIPEIAAFASASVVEIYTETVINSGRMRQFISEGAGSGVIISSDGYILTNNHVIEGARNITVRLNIGIDYEAILIGRDSKTDLAILKIQADDLHPVVIGDSDMLSVGEIAVAIGNPLGKLGGTVTDGVISALSRNIEIDGFMMTLLQTSAAINPGNSGGGLFNAYGELIGVINAKSSGTDIEGLGFAIPINLAKSIADSLIEFGYVPGRVDFGASLINILDRMTAMMYRVQMLGVYVSQVDADSVLQVGDLIISIDGINVHSIEDINEIIITCDVGDELEIVVFRNGIEASVSHRLKQALS